MKKISVCISIACIISSILFANGQKDASGAKTKPVAIAMCIHSTDNAYWNEEAEGGTSTYLRRRRRQTVKRYKSFYRRSR